MPCSTKYSFHLEQAIQHIGFKVTLSTYNSNWSETLSEIAAKAAERPIESLVRFRLCSSGLWPFAALLNHSYLLSAERSNIGNVMILLGASGATVACTTWPARAKRPCSGFKPRRSHIRLLFFLHVSVVLLRFLCIISHWVFLGVSLST
jgi:amino acid permease